MSAPRAPSPKPSVPRLYLVTDRHRARVPLLGVVEAALRGGVDAVQLREKDLATRQLLELARALAALCARYRAPLLINDRIDVAVAVGAAGVHLPIGSFRPDEARTLMGPTALIGASAHSFREAQQAFELGADFVAFGPIFDTESKRRFGSPVGLAALATATERCSRPVLAIGGINTANAVQAIRAGAQGLAVIGAIIESTDPTSAAADLRRRLREN